MADRNYLQNLYLRYKMERRSDELTIEEFEQVLLLFPAVLIAAADGHIDTSEMMQLNKILRHLLAQIREQDVQEYDLKSELRYISWNTKVWRDPFLRCLREYIEEHKLGEMVVDIMIAAASASTGSLINNILLQTYNPDGSTTGSQAQASFISDIEKNEILRITDFLGLSEDAGVRRRLATL